jgi:hypothetical protein
MRMVRKLQMPFMRHYSTRLFTQVGMSLDQIPPKPQELSMSQSPSYGPKMFHLHVGFHLFIWGSKCRRIRSILRPESYAFRLEYSVIFEARQTGAEQIYKKVHEV